jgi:choline transport protein
MNNPKGDYYQLIKEKLFGTISIMTTCSRMAYAFARDGGLPASAIFAQVDQRLQIPFSALCLTTITTLLFGCIFMISSTTFNAITSASVVALSASYALPGAINCAQGRDKLVPSDFTFPTFVR